jgi:hypothetical protein
MPREHVTIVIMETQSSIYIVELHVAVISEKKVGCCYGKAAITWLYI